MRLVCKYAVNVVQIYGLTMSRIEIMQIINNKLIK